MYYNFKTETNGKQLHYKHVSEDLLMITVTLITNILNGFKSLRIQFVYNLKYIISKRLKIIIL